MAQYVYAPYYTQQNIEQVGESKGNSELNTSGLSILLTQCGSSKELHGNLWLR